MAIIYHAQRDPGRDTQGGKSTSLAMHSADLVIFDCDGVLVDSEPIAARLTAESVRELGIAMSAEQAKREFLGDTFANIVRSLEMRLGRPVPADWGARSQARLLDAFRSELLPMAGARSAVLRLRAAGVEVAVGSQGLPEKMQLTLGLTGLLELFEGRIFSAVEVARPKPAPDLFLHAAATLGFAPARTWVVEDSAKGVAAALAAGMRVLGYTASLGEAAMIAAGAEPIDDLALVPERIGL